MFQEQHQQKWAVLLRQTNNKARSMAGTADNRNSAAKFLNNTIHNRKTESGAALFCGIKGFKNFILLTLSNPASAISDYYLYPGFRACTGGRGL
jgi:hypothetical protein